MQSIGDFFKRIGGVQAKEIARRSAIQSAIKEFTETEVPITSISLKSGTVTLKNVSSVLKSVIYTRKKQIIERANILPESTKVVDIR